MTRDQTQLEAQWAASYYLDPFTPLLLAMVVAEGGRDAFVRAIQCSRPDVTDFGTAMAIACKTVRNRVIEYQERGLGPVLEAAKKDGADPWTQEEQPRCLVATERFIAFLAARWAPIGAANDPTNLNQHWHANVLAAYGQLVRHAQEVPHA